MIAGFAGLKKSWDEFFGTQVGQVESFSDWPRHLRTVVQEAEEQGHNLGSLKLYYLDWSYFLQCTENSEFLSWLISRLDLVEIPANHQQVARLHNSLQFLQVAFPRSSAVKYYISETRKEELSDHWYIVAYNEDDGTMLIWYYWDW